MQVSWLALAPALTWLSAVAVGTQADLDNWHWPGDKAPCCS
jgi:hypothetical protein